MTKFVDNLLDGAEKLFYVITGGRPMTFINELFYDPIGREAVCHYRDKFGRNWMATSSWDSCRTEYHD